MLNRFLTEGQGRPEFQVSGVTLDPEIRVCSGLDVGLGFYGVKFEFLLKP